MGGNAELARWRFSSPERNPLTSHVGKVSRKPSLTASGHECLAAGVDITAKLFLRPFLSKYHQLSPMAAPRFQSQLRLATLGMGGVL